MESEPRATVRFWSVLCLVALIIVNSRKIRAANVTPQYAHIIHLRALFELLSNQNHFIQTPVNRERQYKLLPKDIIFCSGLIDAHGEDYNVSFIVF